jgi:hypothetical protein
MVGARETVLHVITAALTAFYMSATDNAFGAVTIHPGRSATQGEKNGKLELPLD